MEVVGKEETVLPSCEAADADLQVMVSLSNGRGDLGVDPESAPTSSKDQRSDKMDRLKEQILSRWKKRRSSASEDTSFVPPAKRPKVEASISPLREIIKSEAGPPPTFNGPEEMLAFEDNTVESLLPGSVAGRLPLQTWKHILSLLCPQDLGRLLTTSKMFFALLHPQVSAANCKTLEALTKLSPSLRALSPFLTADAIWQSSRKAFFPQMRGPEPDQTELDLWRTRDVQPAKMHTSTPKATLKPTANQSESPAASYHSRKLVVYDDAPEPPSKRRQRTPTGPSAMPPRAPAAMIQDFPPRNDHYRPKGALPAPVGDFYTPERARSSSRSRTRQSEPRRKLIQSAGIQAWKALSTTKLVPAVSAAIIVFHMRKAVEAEDPGLQLSLPEASHALQGVQSRIGGACSLEPVYCGVCLQQSATRTSGRFESQAMYRQGRRFSELLSHFHEQHARSHDWGKDMIHISHNTLLDVPSLTDSHREAFNLASEVWPNIFAQARPRAVDAPRRSISKAESSAPTGAHPDPRDKIPVQWSSMLGSADTLSRSRSPNAAPIEDQQKGMPPKTKDNTTAASEEVKQQFLLKIADSFIRTAYKSQFDVKAVKDRRFAIDALLYIRRVYYDKRQSQSQEQEDREILPSGLLSKLDFGDLLWIFSRGIQPHINSSERVRFYCNGQGCESNERLFILEAVIQHYIEKHMRISTKDNQARKAEWKYKPPFSLDLKRPCGSGITKARLRPGGFRVTVEQSHSTSGISKDLRDPRRHQQQSPELGKIITSGREYPAAAVNNEQVISLSSKDSGSEESHTITPVDPLVPKMGAKAAPCCRCRARQNLRPASVVYEQNNMLENEDASDDSI